MAEMVSPSTGALEGLRVIDFTQMLAGPFCTQMLADHGADVIKVEPLAGDGTRRFGPFHPEDSVRLFGGYFQSVNRNKRSLALDLKMSAARDIVLRLIDGADVVVENFRSGVMERLGLSYEELQARNPRLVYAAIRGFGDPRTGESPKVDWPAYDVVSQAMGGIMGVTGPDATSPLKVGPGVGDVIPAMMSAFGILAAVYRTQRTGHGQFVDVAMVDAVLAVCERLVYQHSYLGVVAHPEGNAHPLLCPFGMFPATDGHVTVACPIESFWADLCRIMGRPDLVTDARFATNAARVANSAETLRLVTEFTSRHSKQELVARLGGQIPFGPVYDAADIFADEHFRLRDMIVEVEQPGCPVPVAIAGVPVRLSATPGGVRRRAPLLGEHGAAVLAGLGIDAGTIERWRAAKVIVTTQTGAEE